MNKHRSFQIVRTPDGLKSRDTTTVCQKQNGTKHAIKNDKDWLACKLCESKNEVQSDVLFLAPDNSDCCKHGFRVPPSGTHPKQPFASMYKDDRLHIQSETL